MPPIQRAVTSLLILLAGLDAGSTARAADPERPLRINGMSPGKIRTSATESWGAYMFEVTNPGDRDRQVRVLMNYEQHDYLQYGRDLWVPARSRLSSWMLVGPAGDQIDSATGQSRRVGRDIQMQLVDRTEGGDRFVRPDTEEKKRGRAVPYQRRDPMMVIVLDDVAPEDTPFGKPPVLDPPGEEALALARVLRVTREMSPAVPRVFPGTLTPVPEAYEGVDQVILASTKLANDPEGVRGLRRWLERGGTAWVLLDWVQPEVVAELLGDDMDFQILDRVGLTTSRIDGTGGRLLSGPAQEHERPVDLVRVALPADERPRHTVEGWPAWFTRRVGRGKVVFTTLGARGWALPRTKDDPPSRFADHPAMPIAIPPLETLAGVIFAVPGDESLQPEAFLASLTSEIGYSIVGQRTVLLVFGGFLLASLASIFVLRWSRRPELFGWLCPLAALITAGVFVSLGNASRKAVVPTVAMGQIVDPSTGVEEASVRGLIAAYRPGSGSVQVSATQGGMLALDQAGLDAQIRKFVLTDRGAWHWEGLELPAGVRAGPFRTNVLTEEPIRARIRLGPRGIEGKLSAGRFQELGDAVLSGSLSRQTALRLAPDGTFSATLEDALPPGQFLAGTLLTDRQQRRQALYRKFLERTTLNRIHDRRLVLAWANPLDPGFLVGGTSKDEAETRSVGDALLVIPADLERPAPGTEVAIPGPLVACQRILGPGTMRLVTESQQDADMHLRFQIPTELLPLKVERARLVARLEVPSHRVTVFGRTDGGSTGEDSVEGNAACVELRRVDQPLDAFQADLTEERFLKQDAEGGLHLNLTVRNVLSKSKSVQSSDKWTIHYLELQITGRTEPRP